MQIRQNQKLFGFESFVFLTFFSLSLGGNYSGWEEHTHEIRDDLAEVDLSLLSSATTQIGVAQFSTVAYEIREDWSHFF